MTSASSLAAAARRWRDEDPDPETRQEIDILLAGADAGDDVALAELRDRFANRLEFGTAGLRGQMGAGPNRMNRAMVMRTTAGLAAYLADTGHGGEPVIVGYDARHRSAIFAADVAAVLAAAGHPVKLATAPLPTPLVAFGVRHLRCCAGVQITASHNPPHDNGYKVYLGDGAQIVPPIDAEISARIDAIASLRDVALATVHDDPRVTLLEDALVDAYVQGAVGVALHSPADRAVRVVYTPLHGVGRDVVLKAFAEAGFAAPLVVAGQGDPDPDFPTVAFPNPEEPGALDLAIALARRESADAVLANDPDADRLAVAVPASARLGGPAPAAAEDTAAPWRILTGDEIGILLADWLLAQGEGPDRLVVTTIVSSTMLGRLAAARGVAYEETLTGFKWIVRPALSRPDLRFVYGYEEALGSCIDSLVLDKDGITAALAFAELVAHEKAHARTVTDRLDDLQRELGVHATGQRSLTFPGADGHARMRQILDGLVANPPRSVAGRLVTEIEDLSAGGRLPPTDGVVLRGDGVRLIVRPSGTEPKLKCYAEAVVPVGRDEPDAGVPGEDLGLPRRQAHDLVTKLLGEAVGLLTG